MQCVSEKLLKTVIILLSFVNDIRLALSYPEFVAVVAAIFFPRFILYNVFLILAHLWWFGVWSFGVGVLYWVFGVGVFS